MFLLMLGVFKNKSEKLIYNLSIVILIILLALVVNLFKLMNNLFLIKAIKLTNYLLL